MELLNKYLSGILMPALLILLGIYFAFKFKFFYIFHPLKTIKAMLKNQKQGFKALCVALAGTLGIGNIVGVASAIVMGGAGSVFWMWISAICAMSLKYAEVYLAMKFRKEKDGIFYGGAAYYIKDGLKDKFGFKLSYVLSSIFAILCVINSLTTGNLVQINSVSSITPASPLIFGVVFSALSLIIILGGIKRISRLTAILIPILSVSYILICLFVIISNMEKIPSVITMIFRDAFSLKCATGGFCGFGIASAIRYGVARGVISNEAGCGTAPSAHASSNSLSSHGQGCLGIFEVFIDTILLCTLTALVVLLSEPVSTSPMELVLSSFEKYTGDLGVKLITILCVFFAFATVICQFFYGIESIKFISKRRYSYAIYTVIFCIVTIIGAVIPMSLMWQISDLVIAVMTILNLVCLFFLKSFIL